MTKKQLNEIKIDNHELDLDFDFDRNVLILMTRTAWQLQLIRYDGENIDITNKFAISLSDFEKLISIIKSEYQNCIKFKSHAEYLVEEIKHFANGVGK